jgi:hypothetical protein
MPIMPAQVHQAPRQRKPRWLGILLLSLQALLWGGGSILEARPAAESLMRVTHVEQEGSTDCPPIHSHVDCVVCRTFSSGATPGAAVATLMDEERCADRPPVFAAELPDRALPGAPGPRAPPTGATGPTT